jgi:nucleoside-diphosphate-sugar epimerase
MLRVLVTGCAGFIGSHLAERLLEDGHEVIGVDCLTPFYDPARKATTLNALAEHPAFEHRRLDLSTDPLDELLEGVDVVHHLAGQPGVRQSFDDRRSYLVNNVTATRRLLAAAAGRPLRAFVFASSSSVYGNGRPSGVEGTEATPKNARRPAGSPAAPRRMRETDALAPISPYGHTKVAVEQLARAAFREHGVPAVGMRYFSVYGPRQRPDMAFQRFLERAVADEPLQILGDGTQQRDFTYVGDVVEATLAAAQRGRPGAVYNVGGGHPATLRRVVALLAELLEGDLRVEYGPTAPGDVHATAADTTLARRELGFQPRTELAEGVALQLEWLLAAQPARAVA